MKARHWSIPIIAVVLLVLLLLPSCGGGATTTVTQTAIKTSTSTATATVTTTAADYGGTLRIIWSTGPGGGWGTPVAIFGGEGA